MGPSTRTTGVELVSDSQGWKWDPTISLGGLIAMIPIVVAIVGGSAVAMNRLSDVEKTMLKQGETFERRLSAVEDALVLLRVDAARRETLEAKVVDFESRLRVLERAR